MSGFWRRSWSRWDGGAVFSYRPYDCRSGMLLPSVSVTPGPLTVVEGSYSCHPALWDFYHCRIFLTVPREEQRRRIIRRNGPEGLQVFLEKWIPLEERYFASLGGRPTDGALWIDGGGRPITKEAFLAGG